jgi:homoserine kinase
MYSLDVIRKMNNRAVVPNAVNKRDCSFVESRTGVVLHSAKLRSTVFLAGPAADRFLRTARKSNGPSLNRLIEAWF